MFFSTFFSELKRKSLHILSLIFPIVLLFLPYGKDIEERLYGLIYLGTLAIISILIDILRVKSIRFKKLYFKIFGDILRRHELKGRFTGATNFFISIFLVYLIFPFFDMKLDYIVMVYVGFMIGDAFAAIIGKSMGRIKITKNKTLEGTIGCIIGSFLTISPFIFNNYHNLYPAIFISILIGIFELITFYIDDNFFVPVSTLIVLKIFF